MEHADHIQGAPRALKAFGAFLLVVFALVAAGCGETENQASNAPSGTFKVTVLDWSFDKVQPLGTPQDFTISVRNDDTRQIPRLILTIDGITKTVYQPGAASKNRPIWLPKDVQYAYVTRYNSPNSTSYNLGPLDPGETSTYTLDLTPLRRGEHEVGYRLAPDIFGDNEVVNASDGSEAADTRLIRIDPTPVVDQEVFKD